MSWLLLQLLHCIMGLVVSVIMKSFHQNPSHRDLSSTCVEQEITSAGPVVYISEYLWKRCRCRPSQWSSWPCLFCRSLRVAPAKTVSSPVTSSPRTLPTQGRDAYSSPSSPSPRTSTSPHHQCGQCPFGCNDNYIHNSFFPHTRLRK